MTGINQVLYKTTNAGVKEFAQFKDLYKHICVPHNTPVYDLVQISRKDGSRIDILTFKDKAKKIVRRYFFEKTQNGERVTEQFFKKNKEAFINDPACYSNQLSVTGRKISSVTKLNGEYTGKTEEIQTVTHTSDGNIVHISKIKENPIKISNKNLSDETVSLYEYSKFRPKKGYEISNIIKYRNGEPHKEITPNYKFEEFPEIAQIAYPIDRYFPLHLYSLKQFKKKAPYIASHPSHKTVFPVKIKWYNEYDSTVSGRCLDEDKVYLNNRVINNKLDVINNSAHEKEHAYQHEQAMWYSDKEYKEERGANSQYDMFIDDIEKARQYKFNFEHYTKPEEDLYDYKNQIVEKDARKAGYVAEKRYKQSAQNLKKDFPYAPDYLIGYSQEDKIKSDSLRGGLLSFDDYLAFN